MVHLDHVKWVGEKRTALAEGRTDGDPGRTDNNGVRQPGAIQ